MCGLLAGLDKSIHDRKVVTGSLDCRKEVRVCHNGFCDSLAFVFSKLSATRYLVVIGQRFKKHLGDQLGCMSICLWRSVFSFITHNFQVPGGTWSGYIGVLRELQNLSIRRSE